MYTARTAIDSTAKNIRTSQYLMERKTGMKEAMNTV